MLKRPLSLQIKTCLVFFIFFVPGRFVGKIVLPGGRKKRDGTWLHSAFGPTLAPLLDLLLLDKPPSRSKKRANVPLRSHSVSVLCCILFMTAFK